MKLSVGSETDLKKSTLILAFIAVDLGCKHGIILIIMVIYSIIYTVEDLLTCVRST